MRTNQVDGPRFWLKSTPTSFHLLLYFKLPTRFPRLSDYSDDTSQSPCQRLFDSLWPVASTPRQTRFNWVLSSDYLSGRIQHLNLGAGYFLRKSQNILKGSKSSVTEVEESGVDESD